MLFQEGPPKAAGLWRTQVAGGGLGASHFQNRGAMCNLPSSPILALQGWTGARGKRITSSLSIHVPENRQVGGSLCSLKSQRHRRGKNP